MIAFISAGAIQLLVGPASFSSTEQMKVRSSTRATSVGSEAAWKELGFFSALSRVNVPVATSASVSSVHSSSEPVHQCTRSGWVSSAISATQDEDALVGRGCAAARCGLWLVSAVMLTGSSRAFASAVPGAAETTRRPPGRPLVDRRWCRGVAS